MKKTFALSIVVLTVCVNIFIITLAEKQYEENIVIVDCNGSGDFLTIQEAIDGVSDGTKIVVKEGIYEPITVNKELKIFAEDNVIIYANGSEECIWVSKSNTIIDGFITTEGTSNGICIVNEKWSSNRTIIHNITISNCTVYNNGRDGQGAIFAYVVSNLTIENCHVHDNVYIGILLSFVSNVTIDSCLIEDNTGDGITMNNIVFGCPPDVPEFSRDNIFIKNCIIRKNNNGIYTLNIPHVNIINSALTENGLNIITSYCYPNETIAPPVIRILNNSITDARIGLQFHTMKFGEQNIRYTKDDILIKGNTFSGNDIGMLLYDISIEAIVIHNNFIDNDLHASFSISKPVKNVIVTSWNNNYWDNCVLMKWIIGSIGSLPWFSFDFHPAKTPY